MIPEAWKSKEPTEEEFDAFLETSLNNSLNLYKTSLKRIIKNHATETGTFRFDTNIELSSDISMSNSCGSTVLIHKVDIDVP